MIVSPIFYSIVLTFIGARNCNHTQATHWYMNTSFKKCDINRGPTCDSNVWTDCVLNFNKLPVDIIIIKKYDCDDCLCTPYSITGESPTRRGNMRYNVLNSGNVLVERWNPDGVTTRSHKVLGNICYNSTKIYSKRGRLLWMTVR